MDGRPYTWNPVMSEDILREKEYRSQTTKIIGEIRFSEGAIEHVISSLILTEKTRKPLALFNTGLPLDENQISWIAGLAKDGNEKNQEGMQPNKNIDISAYGVSDHAREKVKTRIKPGTKSHDKVVDDMARNAAKNYINSSAIMIKQLHKLGPTYIYMSPNGHVVLSIDHANIVTIYTDEEFIKEEGYYIKNVIEGIEKCILENKKKNS